jgi:hypothetical protein
MNFFAGDNVTLSLADCAGAHLRYVRAHMGLAHSKSGKRFSARDLWNVVGLLFARALVPEG